MNNQEFIIKKENILSVFIIGWLAFLSTLKLSIKHIIFPVIGQLFGILLLALVPVLEYREMINVMNTPDGWIYFILSLAGAIILSFSIWKFLLFYAVQIYWQEISMITVPLQILVFIFQMLTEKNGVIFDFL